MSGDLAPVDPRLKELPWDDETHERLIGRTCDLIPECGGFGTRCCLESVREGHTTDTNDDDSASGAG
jgi:hypothetical protein